MLKKKELEELEELTKPVIEWLNKNCDPYESVVVTCDEVQVVGIHAGIPL